MKMLSRFLKKWPKGEAKEGEFTPQVVKSASSGQFEKMVQALDKLGEEVNCTDTYQHSALFYAALNGHKKCLKELLRRGADPNQADKEGLTPCHAVALSGRNCRKVQKDDTNCCDYSFVNGMCLQCVDGICKLLPHNRLNAKCRRRCLEYLVQYGGDLQMYTYQKQETTKDIAERRGKTSIVNVIDEYYCLQADHNINKEIAFPPTMNTSTLWMNYSFQQQPGQQKKLTIDNTVPELAHDDIEKHGHQVKSMDGSVWSRGVWAEGVQVTLRMIASRPRKSGEKHSEAPVMCVEFLLREIDNLRDLRHPHIALLMAVCSGPCREHMFIALEPLCTSSLYIMMHKEHSKFSHTKAVSMLSDITRAVAYLHNSQGLAHNILSSHAVYLTHKGTAKLCNVFCCQPPATQLPGLCSPALRLFLPWMAPELMQNRIAALESDIFSLGVLLWEVWSGTPPWPGLTPPQLGRVLIQNGQRLPLTNNHTHIAPILKSCFGPPGARLHAAQLLSQINYIKMREMYQVV